MPIEKLALKKGKSCPEKRKSCQEGVKILLQEKQNIVQRIESLAQSKGRNFATRKGKSYSEDGKIFPIRSENLNPRKG